ncbi:MAG: LysR family transcriptional regulator [Clostridia bacterium]|nr:LysR family transcriptional regulator [Clostridia bacterium]
MRIEWLKSFIAVVDNQCFSRAARQLYLTQSALSKQIAVVEREAGRQLLSRTTRAVEVTEAGRLFYRRSERIIREWEALKKEMRQVPDSQPTPLLVGYTTSEQLPYILGGMRRMQAAGTEVEVITRRVHPNDIIRETKAQVLDCAVMHRPTLANARGLSVAVLSRPAMTAIVSLDDPIAGLPKVSVREVCKLTDVRCSRERDPAYYAAIDEGFTRMGLTAPAYIETEESEEVAILVKKKGRMSLCPSLYPAWDEVVAVPISDFKPNFDFLLVRASNPKNRMQVDALAAGIRAFCAEKCPT